jgi:hypothetical protein
MRTKKLTPIERLQNWYLSQCNGDWEHLYGVKIDNIDNPGWSVDIDLSESVLENRLFEELNIQRKNEHDWFICRVEGSVFKGRGGPKNLDEILEAFCDWVQIQSDV